MSALSSIRASSSLPSLWLRSSVTPRLLAFRYMNRPLLSGCGVSPGKGPRRRVRSPAGGSTLITSAPRSPRSFAAYAAETPSPHSTTEIPFSAPLVDDGAIFADSAIVLPLGPNLVPLNPASSLFYRNWVHRRTGAADNLKRSADEQEG